MLTNLSPNDRANVRHWSFGDWTLLIARFMPDLLSPDNTLWRAPPGVLARDMQPAWFSNQALTG